jgi:hypothetical protein
MQTFLNATTVTVTIPLLDSAGNALPVATAQYRVTDSNGAEVGALTPVSVAAEAETVSITTSELLNTMAPLADANVPGVVIEPLESRTVELHLVTSDGNTILLTQTYLLQRDSILILGANTFQTLAKAEINARAMTGLDNWHAASDEEKVSALLEARYAMASLTFTNVSDAYDQSNISYQGFNHSGVAFTAFGGDITKLTPVQYAQLPPKFKKALEMAQLAQANASLGGDAVADKRIAGLIAETVGESRQQYRAGNPLRMPVVRKAMNYLTGYITYARVIGRG